MGSEGSDYVFWTIFLVLLYLKLVMSKNGSEYGTSAVYACDGSTLKLECKEGYVINVVRANYGRYSITVCNENGSTDWSVNCMSFRGLQVLQARCNAKKNCSVPATTSLFDDPCPGTSKYLEAHYACVSATTSSSTARPSPPWLATSPPSIWSTKSSFTFHPEIVSSTSSSVSTDGVATSTKSQYIEREFEDNDWIPTNTIPEITSESDYISHFTKGDRIDAQSSSSKSSDVFNDEQIPLCRPTMARNLAWNWTAAGVASIQACPGGASGFARWECQLTLNNIVVRVPETPDLSECRSVWLNNLENRINDNDSLIKIASELAQVTESKILFGGDMDTATKIIRSLATKMSKDILSFADPRQREAIVYDLLQSVVKVASNMLDTSQQPSWKDLSYKEQMRVATTLLVGLEENSFLLADTVVREKLVTHCTKNMLLSVQVVETRNVGDETFPTYGVLENCTLGISDWLELPKASLVENSENGLVRLVYMTFETLDQVLKIPASGNDAKKINSKVLSASLGQGRHIQLTNPVTLCLQHLQTENVSNPTCVFWDYTQGNWSNEGCTVVSTNETHTVCRCDHLTNFAILVDVKTTYSSGQVSLSVLVFLVMSLVMLLAIILVFLVKYVRTLNSRKAYSSAFVHENEWFAKCFACCHTPVETEKSLGCKDSRPALYGNATMQSITSMDNEGATICTTHIPHTSNTIPRSYISDNNLGLESHYSGSHMRINSNYPTYNKNSGIRKMKEARRLEHIENTLQYRNKKLAGTLGSNSPRSHTYSEIAAGSSRTDPVYEEIEREREHFSQISDVSDEDPKRHGDTNRKWPRNYGDHRPLIPYSQGPDCNFHATLDAVYRQQLKEQCARTISVLDGQTVVCHLQQADPRIYQKSVSHLPHY